MTSRLWPLMSKEDQEQEIKWQEEKDYHLRRLVDILYQAVPFHQNQKARQALYQKWRKDYGDDRAREAARYTEECVKGKVTIKSLSKGLTNVQGQLMYPWA